MGVDPRRVPKHDTEAQISPHCQVATHAWESLGASVSLHFCCRLTHNVGSVESDSSTLDLIWCFGVFKCSQHALRSSEASINAGRNQMCQFHRINCSLNVIPAQQVLICCVMTWHSTHCDGLWRQVYMDTRRTKCGDRAWQQSLRRDLSILRFYWCQLTTCTVNTQ